MSPFSSRAPRWLYLVSSWIHEGFNKHCKNVSLLLFLKIQNKFLLWSETNSVYLFYFLYFWPLNTVRCKESYGMLWRHDLVSLHWHQVGYKYLFYFFIISVSVKCLLCFFTWSGVMVRLPDCFICHCNALYAILCFFGLFVCLYVCLFQRLYVYIMTCFSSVSISIHWM